MKKELFNVSFYLASTSNNVSIYDGTLCELNACNNIYQNCFLLAVESNSQFMEFKFVRNIGLFQNKSVNLKKYFRDCVIIIMRGAEKQEAAPYKLRGEEQNREEGEMAQEKLGGGRKREVNV